LWTPYLAVYSAPGNASTSVPLSSLRVVRADSNCPGVTSFDAPVTTNGRTCVSVYAAAGTELAIQVDGMDFARGDFILIWSSAGAV
jgi:hypothetical protein